MIQMIDTCKYVTDYWKHSVALKCVFELGLYFIQIQCQVTLEDGTS